MDQERISVKKTAYEILVGGPTELVSWVDHGSIDKDTLDLAVADLIQLQKKLENTSDPQEAQRIAKELFPSFPKEDDEVEFAKRRIKTYLGYLQFFVEKKNAELVN